VVKNEIEIVQILLDHGANVLAVNRTALPRFILRPRAVTLRSRACCSIAAPVSRSSTAPGPLPWGKPPGKVSPIPARCWSRVVRP
jgi:hypothetical protein